MQSAEMRFETPGCLPLEVYQTWPAGQRPWGMTQDSLAGLYLQVNLRAAGDLLEEAGRSWCRPGLLCFPCWYHDTAVWRKCIHTNM